jgi:hypothetical protein
MQDCSRPNQPELGWLRRLTDVWRFAIRSAAPPQIPARRLFLFGASATALILATGCMSAPRPPPPPGPSGTRGPGTSGAAGDDPLPNFPWQPPRPTARLELKVLNKPEYKTFGDIADAIESAANKAGFGDAVFYSVPGGFAVLVQPEVIGSNLSPLSPRFLTDTYANEKPWLVKMVEYISEAYNGPKNSRQIAILVTDRTIQPTEKLTETSSEQLQRVFDGGARDLPASVRDTPRPSGCKATAMVYHFQIKSNGKVHQRFVASSKEPQLARTHLERAQLTALV